MTTILFIIGFFVFVVFRNDWKKSVYLLTFMLPFFGFIHLKIIHLTLWSPLIQDITIIIPMYLFFILNQMKKKNDQFFLSSRLKNTLIFFVLFIFIFAINPFYEVGFLARVIGVKVWIFYLLFVFIGFEFIESKSELIKFCKFFAIVAIIPCIVGVLQYLGSYFLDMRETMLFFFNGNETLAYLSTQGYSKFDWGGGLMIYRLPSTFSFASQFNQYLLFALVPAIASMRFSKTNKEKYFYLMVIIVIILGSFTAGARGNILFLLLFFLFLLLIQARFYVLLFLLIPSILLLSFINLQQFPYLQVIFSNVKDLTVFYGGAVFFEDLGYILSNHFLGNGVGSYTFEARYATGAAQDVINTTFARGAEMPYNEGYYHKVILELGVVGLLVIIAFYMIIIHEIILSINNLKDDKTSFFCALVLAFLLLVIILLAKSSSIIVKYPVNFLFFFFLGITIKLRYLDFNKDT